MLEQVDVCDVLLGDFQNGNIVDVDFVAPDQKEQQVQRTVVYVKFDAVVLHDTRAFSVTSPQASRTRSISGSATARAFLTPSTSTSST